MLGRLTIAVILIVVGVVWVLDRAEVLFPEPAHYAAIVLGLTGLGLLVGAWIGRSRGLIGLGLIVLPFFLFFSYVNVPWSEGFGERNFAPTTVSGQSLRYELAGGQMIIDLTDLDFSDRDDLFVEADLGFGELRVIVPRNTTVSVTADVVGGEIDLFGSTVAGFTVDKTVSSGNAADLIVLDLHVGFGQLTVSRGS